MIKRKSKDEIKKMRHAGHIVALVHQEMKKIIEPGITTKYLNDVALDIIKKNKAIPTFFGYNGFPASICASVNEQVVHGIPSDIILKEGDIISVDVGATYGGLVGDGAWTYAVGEISGENKRLLKATEESLLAGIAKMIEGNTLDIVGGAVEDVAKREKLGIVRQYGGHGVGHVMHEEPFIVLNYRSGNKTVLKSGMTIALEPMLTLGCDEVEVMSDEWTVCTIDKKVAAHFEHSVLITDSEPIILTTIH